ncbi:hypothetical protein LS73_004250 [Helicobacter muridarum]|uniref:Uncharacterized protein n=1 Tax=Helicobacter muridarum TaxID=216 RepID=A0A4U8TKH1_9HELI|nr:hypothetical protein [Helicobacter muridarum]TLE00626.1 hypothetical protein LS73_004250 [Helicobacter muridarum]
MYYLEHRVDLHLDEVLSIVLSEYNDYGWGKFYEDGIVLDSNTIKEKLLWNDPTISGAFRDIAKLWKNNRDRPHTNLYYSIFRLWHIGFIDNDTKSLLYRGISLNLVLFAFSFVLAICLVRNLLLLASSNSNTMQVCILVFLMMAFLNPASITNTLFMRPYMLQECLFILFLWANSMLFCLLNNCNINPTSPKDLKPRIVRMSCFLIISTSLLLLSGYFTIAFVTIIFMVCGIYTALCIKRYIYIYIYNNLVFGFKCFNISKVFCRHYSR